MSPNFELIGRPALFMDTCGRRGPDGMMCELPQGHVLAMGHSCHGGKYAWSEEYAKAFDPMIVAHQITSPGALTPEAVDNEALHESMHRARYDLALLTQADAYRILAAAECYCHLTGAAPTTNRACDQLRTIRRAVQAQRRCP